MMHHRRVPSRPAQEIDLRGPLAALAVRLRKFHAQHVTDHPTLGVAVQPPRGRPIARAFLPRAGLFGVDQFDGASIRAHQRRRIARYRQDGDPARCRLRDSRRPRPRITGGAWRCGRLRSGEPCLGSELLDRFGVTQILGLHDEGDRIAMSAAAEAVKKSLGVDDVK
jgi:hypothetical protein